MKIYRRVIFAGEDNICESIIAEAIFKNIIGTRPIDVLSRGLVVLFPEPVNSKAVKVLEEHGLKPSKSYSEELKPEDITKDTLILTLKKSQAEKIDSLVDKEYDIYSLRSFVGYVGDPVTPVGDYDKYRASFEHLDLLVKAAAQMIFEPIDEELSHLAPTISPEEVEKVVQQVFEESVLETLGEAGEIAVEKRKIDKEKMLEEEYLEVVEKTAAREAAREAAINEPISEYKILYEEIKANNSKNISESKEDREAEEENNISEVKEGEEAEEENNISEVKEDVEAEEENNISEVKEGEEAEEENNISEVKEDVEAEEENNISEVKEGEEAEEENNIFEVKEGEEADN